MYTSCYIFSSSHFAVSAEQFHAVICVNDISIKMCIITPPLYLKNDTKTLTDVTSRITGYLAQGSNGVINREKYKFSC